MEKGYYLCKVLTFESKFKKVYEGRILYWDKEWLDGPDSFFKTKDANVLSYMKIPNSYFESVIV